MIKFLRLVTGLAGGFLVGVALSAETPRPAKTNENHAHAVELLRKLIKEQQQHPDRIIRVPGESAATRPSKAPSSQPSATATTAAPRLTRPELERQFLEGKLTAKQYQRAIEDLEKNPPPPTPTPPPAPVQAATAKNRDVSPTLPPRASSTLPGKVPTNAVAGASGEDAPEQKVLSDVEAKIDEILARREAQVQAAKTNAAAANATPTGPLTKRDKLDGLLRQLIQGRITDAEYKTQREKVLAQPD